MSSADFQPRHPGSHSESTSSAKTRWSLTQEAFDKLLDSFSLDRNEAGDQYEVVRRKLVRFFEWRAVDSADELADETINRVARRIVEGQSIENLHSYFYGVARLVFMEADKDRKRAPVALDDAPESLHQRVVQESEPDARVVCFDRCLNSLPPESRQLIVNYYQEERRAKIELRQQLADSLHIPLNALRIRAHRIRMTLEKCINGCLQTPVHAK